MRVAPDADGEPTAQGGLGTTDDPQATAPAATTAPEPPASEPTDLERRYWASLNAEAQQRAQDLRIEGWATATHGPADNDDARLCKVYYFHTDQVGMPEELSNSQGQLVWQASYRTWGSTVTEEWEIKGLAGQRLHPLDQGDTPQSETEKQQNLRFQGQYLDRETGLHYNTFRYYDPDVGRFICPDPIGLDGGINLGSYSPNPIAWIDPWGWCPTKLGKDMGARKGDGMANHHLIPEEVMKNPAYKDLFDNARKSGFDGDRASNGIFLPGSKDLAQKTGLPGHWSNHKNYTNAVEAQVAALNNMFKRGQLSDMDVVLGLGNIQRNARSGLNNGVFGVDPVTGRLD